MRKITLQAIILLTAVFTGFNSATAQQTFTINASAPWIGYMNVFDLSNNYLFGTFWGVPDMKTTLNTGANTVTFQPNFNTYSNAIASGDPIELAYWTNGAGGGNKIMEAISFVEPSGVSGQNITFTGSVASNTLDAAYTRVAFIKFLDPNIGYAQTFYTDAPLGAAGSTFTLNAAVPALPANLIVQYGVTIRGINANPANEAALGSIVLSPAISLGLDLKSFEASLKNNQVSLEWNTVNEVNVKSFELEKSTNAKQFETVQTITAKNGAENEYTAIDAATFGTTYYRLKMIDMDGKHTYSSTVKVSHSKTGSELVFPVPATNQLNVIAAEGHADIYTVTGIRVKSVELNSGLNTIDISTLADGLYFIKFENGNQYQVIKK